MIKITLSLSALLCTFVGFAQSPIFNSSMAISGYGSVNSPFNEEVDKIIDGNVNTKFLDFNHADGMGFTVDCGSAYIVTGITITTANDAVGRDPQNFEVLGSNDGSSFTSIATGNIPCVADRFHPRTFNFTNAASYSHYRIIYSTQCSSENSIQISETQLLGVTLGTEDVQLSQNAVKLAPNPSTGSVTITSAQGIPLQYADVYSVSGKRLVRVDLNALVGSTSLDLELPSGLYFMTFNTNQGVLTKKIIIQ